jgi:G3E family GTPase
MSVSPPIPVYLLTGFLGSGKTTLLNRLLPHYPDSALLINELGDIGIDDQLVKHHNMPVQLLAGGCICCTVQGELLHTLRNLFIARQAGGLHFDRLIIETTGAADPASIVELLTKDRFLTRQCALAGVIATVDAEAGEHQFDATPEVIDQILAADLLLLTKADRADAQVLAQLDARLQQINPTADRCALCCTEAPEDLLDHIVRRARCCITGLQPMGKAAAVPTSHALVLKPVVVLKPAVVTALSTLQNGIQAASLRLDVRATEAQILSALSALFRECSDGLLRFKGLFALRDTDLPFLIQACRQKLEFPELLGAWPSDDHSTRMVLIVRAAEAGYAQQCLDSFGHHLEIAVQTPQAVNA